MGRKLDISIINKKFHNLFVESHAYTIKKQSYFNCICDCGNKKIIAKKHLGKDTFSCGCLRRKTCGKRNWLGYENVSGEYLNKIRHHADIRNVIFNIKAEDIWQKYLSQDKKCNLSGLNIDFVTNYKGKRELQTASVDRIDSSLGYFPENIQIVHKEINIMKWSLPEEEFLKFVFLVCRPLKSIHTSNNLLYDQTKKHRGFCGLSLSRYNKIIIDAKSRNIPFSISIEDCWNLFVKQRGKCNITGLDIHFPKTTKISSGTASLDRINNNIGYTIDNIQWVHKTMNAMKLDKTMNRLNYLCNLIYNFKSLNKMVNNYEYQT